MKTIRFSPTSIFSAAIMIAAIVIALPGGAPQSVFAQSETAVVTRVVDGDTVEATVGGVPLTIRYIGVDTPESKKPNTPVQCYALEATEANRALVLGQTVTLERDRTNYDRFGRLLRYVYLADGRMVNEELVKMGAGFSKRYAPDTRYAARLDAAQAAARTSRAGLWGACNVVDGATQPLAGGGAAAPVVGVAAPSGRGSAAPVDAVNCPATHPIKGNRNSMIYHKPGQQAYGKTRPEQCFATDADAVAAGYRAAKR